MNIMKIYNKFKKIALLTIVLVAAGACTDDWDELNTSPTLLAENVVQPETIFTSVLRSSILASYDRNRIGEFSSYYANQATGNIFSVANYTSPFNWYGDYIINIKEVERLTADNPRKNDQNAMAKIWKVWLFHIVTDIYGDIPYHEAAQPVNSVINQPAYDSQEEIYRAMLTELDEAEAQLGSQGDQISMGNADIMYQGDIESWKKFANSLRFRLAIRARFADPGLASQHVNDVIDAPLIDENSENASLATLPPTATESSSNVNEIWTSNVQGSANTLVGFGITNVMNPTDDPRRPIYFEPASDGSGYRGRPVQLLQEEKDPYGTESVATIGPWFLEEVVEIIIFEAAETYFLRAEAAFADITGEDANEMYREGIETNMERYNVPQAEIADFLSEPVGTLDGTEEEQFEKIATQRYIAQFWQHSQGYAIFRRTGYPKVWIGSEPGITGGEFPRRFDYPDSEYLKNEENVLEAAARMGGDEVMTRVWWDARPGVPFDHPLQGEFPPN